MFVEAEIRKNAELTTLAEEFRLYANELVDMLDGRVPFVSRFKVRIRYKMFMLERLGFEITCQTIARQLLTIILTIYNCQQELLSVSYNNKSTYKCSCYLHIFAIHKKTKRNSLSFACTTMQTVI